MLDVWETEPDPDAALVDAVRLATPHIAGYSLEGKLAGTRMIAAALQHSLGVAPGADPAVFAAADRGAVDRGRGRRARRGAGSGARASTRSATTTRLRSALAHPDGTRAQAFDGLRRDYPVRREFAGYTIRGAALGQSERALLAALGFAVASRRGASPGVERDRLPGAVAASPRLWYQATPK